jgi:hypothetical protein
MDALRERVGPIRIPSGVQAMFFVLMLIGVVSFFVEKASDPTRVRRLPARLLVLHGPRLAGTFFTAIQYATGATWSVVVRRVAESFTSYLPVALVLLLVVWLGIPNLYVWSSNAAGEAGTPWTSPRGPHLSSSFFAVRPRSSPS